MHYTYLSYFQSGLVTLIKSWVCFSFLASGPSSLYIYAGLVFFLPSILLRWICSSTTIENRKVLKFRIICCKRYFPSSQFKCAAMTSWTGVGEFFMCNSNAASESPRHRLYWKVRRCRWSKPNRNFNELKHRSTLCTLARRTPTAAMSTELNAWRT